MYLPFSLSLARWVLAAEDICLRKPIFSYVFRSGMSLSLILIFVCCSGCKKVLCDGVSVGNLSMEEKQNFQNVHMSSNFLVSLA
ncbi:hypothetical protein AALP_AA7G132600 [Arabis alpina]|uniref:Uncharacterized protein n=1 Tax=Arabis alpina TaxID=50452 RepID=A0A087GHR9_ARAAL|nr:hypothetical protein AALP_AA7G132600 [Arabis alpina]